MLLDLRVSEGWACRMDPILGGRCRFRPAALGGRRWLLQSGVSTQSNACRHHHDRPRIFAVQRNCSARIGPIPCNFRNCFSC